jgi:short-subunit dehydrogenase
MTSDRVLARRGWTKQGGAMSFASQTAIVTGASSGIGWALAKALAGEGAKVGLVARRRDKLDELAGEIRAAGQVAVPAAADIADRRQTFAAISEIARQLGPVDLLIANAGVAPWTYLEPFNIDDVESIVRTNVLGVIHAVAAVLPEMLRRRRGHLAAVSSLASYRGLPGDAAYCASKAAVNTFMEGLRLDLRSRGIRVTTICPGFVRTPMTAAHPFPMPWLMEPEDVAARILQALHRRQKFVAFPWQLSWLLRLSRWLPDWVVARYMGQSFPSPPRENEKSPHDSGDEPRK